MTRILSYNIQIGAKRRVDQVERMIRSVDPDVVGLVEANNPQVVKELARRLDMQYVMTGYGTHEQDWNDALLTRFPIVNSQVHDNPYILTKPVLEVTFEESDGRRITAFVAHLSAAFNQGRAGDHIRRREVRELLRIMAAQHGEAHLIMGDFNNLAPGDAFRASALLRYVVEMDPQVQGDPVGMYGNPYLNFVIPAPLRFFNPLLRLIPDSKLLSALFDGAASLYAPRGSIALLRSAGYVDCYRAINPGVDGFTCPAQAPAGRIDFIFASPELAADLIASRVVTEADGVSGEQASDHFPVAAEFGVPAHTLQAVGAGVEDQLSVQ